MEIATVGGSANGVYYPVTATLNGNQESLTIGKNQSSFSFAKQFEPGLPFSIAFDGTINNQSCSSENAGGTTVNGLNSKTTLNCVNTHYGFYGTAASESFNGIAATSDGGTVAIATVGNNLIFSGSVNPPVTNAHSGGSTDMVVIKFNAVGEVEWHNYFGTAAVGDTGIAVAATADGGCVISGSVSAAIPAPIGLTPVTPYSGTQDILIMKLSNTGVPQWYTYLGSDAGGSKTAVGVGVAGDGSVYVTGTGSGFTSYGSGLTLNGVTGTGDILLAKLSPTGAGLWGMFIGGSSGDTASAVAATADGGVIVSGTLANTPQTNIVGGSALNAAPGGGANSDAILARFGPSGVGLWHMYVGSSAGTDLVSGLAPMADGSIVISGQTGAMLTNLPGSPTAILPYGGAIDIFALKLTAVNSIEWLTYLGGMATENSGALAQTHDAGFVVMGQATANFTLSGLAPLNGYNSGSDALQVKLNANGVVQWYQFFGTIGTDVLAKIVETKDRGIAVAGGFGANVVGLKGLSPKNSFGGGTSDPMILKLTSNGGI